LLIQITFLTYPKLKESARLKKCLQKFFQSFMPGKKALIADVVDTAQKLKREVKKNFHMKN